MDSLEIKDCLREAIACSCAKCPAHGFVNCTMIDCKTKRWIKALARANREEVSK